MLDEATSALDRELERRVRHAIAQRLAGRTILVISHRPEAVAGSAHVVRIEDGRVRGVAP
jgi:ABC-type bacteriocin/lantibiotic exporter with double-glycine peptidase domain